MVDQSYEKITNLKLELELDIIEMKKGSLSRFPCIEKIGQCSEQLDTFVSWLEILLNDFESRFQDFERIKPLMKFSKNLPGLTFSELEEVCKILNQDFEISCKEFNALKSMLSIDNSDSNFLRVLSEKPTLSLIRCKIQSIFSSSYNCEQAFSHLNFIVNEYRSQLTQEHIENLLMIKMSKNNLNLEILVKRTACQISH